jgi:DNA polymerase-3 subunit beta
MARIVAAWPDASETVTLLLSERASTVSVMTATMTASVRVISGEFPDLMRVVPTNPATSIECGRVELASASQTATAFSLGSQNPNAVALKIAAGDAETPPMLTVSGASSESGDGTAEIELSAFNGEQLTITCNGKYLRDVLAWLKCERVTVDLVSPVSPMILRADDAPNDIWVIMPMHIAGK